MQPSPFFKPDPKAAAELRALSPLLADLRPKAKEAEQEFAPSADYFAAMQTRVWAEIEGEKNQVLPAPPLRSWAANWVKYAAAAAFIVGIVSTALLLNTTDTPAPLAKKAAAYEQLLAEIDATDAEAYLLENIDDIDLQLLKNSDENYDDLSAEIYMQALSDQDILDENLDYDLDDDF